MLKDDAEFFLVKASHEDLIDRAGGQKRAAGLVNLSQQQMSNVQNRKHGALLTVRGKLLLERDCGEPVATRVEAELLGFRLERLGPAPLELDDCPLSAHAAVMQEVADVCRVFAQAQADGRYSRTDALTVGRELAELRRTIERFERVNAKTMAGPS